ncbi:cobalamin biosynthesis protein CobD/CbiB [Colwellia sp. PAMC 20917]|uniref:cobalamin biosynthesis protein CobD/CbiB n=1 Tax=Colwellia sp. PAMC 20917 TaxID=1816218 RepID=UPI000878F486|nr:CobD/CbiB family cobalamin biosynthesis protein [Colwellia sp. PAMC 20917]
MTSSVIMVMAYLLDRWFGEVKRFHPLVGFGWLSTAIEHTVNFQHATPKTTSILLPRLLGILSWLILCLPLPILYYYFHQNQLFFWCLDALVLYFAIGLKSLQLHALQIFNPLNKNDLATARYFCGYLVSRNTADLSEQEISRATVESVLENGHDAAVASFFWFIIGGIPLVILHRLANTLDAMWGYKNQRFINFGWCAARMDDLLGWPSAKITALLYACQTNFSCSKMISALNNGYRQGQHYKSLNGGWVMATGASALNFTLGGTATYHGKTVTSTPLGCGNSVVKNDIFRSINLVNKAVIILMFTYFCYQLLHYFYSVNL